MSEHSAVMQSIRAALPTDAEAIGQLFEQTIRSAPWLPEPARDETNFPRASTGETIFVCTSDEGSLQGFISVWVPESFIHHLYVAPQFQHQGVATALLNSLETWLPLPWRLKCTRANSAALAFYASLGWMEVGEGESEQGPYVILEYQQA